MGYGSTYLPATIDPAEITEPLPMWPLGMMNVAAPTKSFLNTTRFPPEALLVDRNQSVREDAVGRPDHHPRFEDGVVADFHSSVRLDEGVRPDALVVPQRPLVSPTEGHDAEQRQSRTDSLEVPAGREPLDKLAFARSPSSSLP
jgi:hypothetical protein